MAQPKRQEGPLTAAALATYGIPPKPPEGPKLVKVQEQATEGKVHERKGQIKEEVGKLTNDSNLEVSGKAEKKACRVQSRIGHAERAAGE
jgi:uncharacterized protein YjbJ (UPF0337 family)